MKQNKTLKKQFSIIVGLIFLSTFIVFALSMIPLKDKLEHKVFDYVSISVNSFMKLTSDELANDYILHQYDAIELTCENIFKINGIKHISAYTNENEILFSKNEISKQKIKYINEVKDEDKSKLDHHEFIFKYKNENVLPYRFKITAIGKELGYVVIYYSIDEFIELISKIEKVFYAFVIIFIFFNLYLVNLLLKRLVVNPINNIMSVIKDIKNGKTCKQVVITNFNEIGAMSKNFNELFAKNNEMLNELELINSNLELKVEKRTLELKEHNNKLTKTENDLKLRIKEFEYLINTIMEAIIIFDNDHCVELNDSCLKLFGFTSKEEVLRKEVHEFICSDSQDLFIKNSRLDLKTPYELDGIKKDGTIFPILIKEETFDTINGKYKILAIMDLTDVKKKEKVLSLNSKMASMGEMLENIAHQWRQPLNTISVAASGLKVQREFSMLTDDMLYDSLDGIVEASTHMSTTIDDFKNFFKPDNNKHFFYLKDILSKTFNLISSKIKSKDIELIENVDDIQMFGLQNELIQVLINVINNSIEAFEDCTYKRLLFINIYKENDNVIIQIKDNAGGIKEDIVDRIYEPYFTTKHQYNGTGLGLYMTKEIIVKHMHGDLKFKNASYSHSGINQFGAEFTISIPTGTN